MKHPIVMEAWREMCLMIQPGSTEGMQAQAEAIAVGPDIYPDDDTIKQMEASKNDWLADFEDHYSEAPTAFQAVLDGVIHAGIEPEEERRFQENYGKFIKWAAEVFPG